MALRRVGTKKPIIINIEGTKTQPQYPRTWFESHEQQKPKATVNKTTHNLETLTKNIHEGVINHRLTSSMAKVFLYQYFKTVELELEDNWVSFGLTIGIKQTKITPWAIIDVSEVDGSIEPESTLRTSPPTMESLILYILGVYRLSRVSNQTYRDSLTVRIDAQIKGLGGESLTLQGAPDYYKPWMSDTGLNKMIAAIDMYFYRFRDHELSVLRMGSLASRFKDCAALFSLAFIVDLLGCKPEDIPDWSYVDDISDDLVRLTKEGEECNDEYSYFPYQVEMKLVSKSAYSSVSNPCFFHFVHIVGSLLTSERSKNARFDLEKNVINVTINAVCVAYVFGRGGVIKQRFTKDGKMHNADQERDLPEDDVELDGIDEDELAIMRMTGTDGNEWYKVFKSLEFRFPKTVKEFIKLQQGKITEPREHTVGEYVKRQLTY